jgi:RNA polymerase sigma-70 factor (ECF subfamily)
MIPVTPDSRRLVSLLAAIGGGDSKAFAELYECCSPHLFGMLLHVLQHRIWAEEAMQQCFLGIWEKSEIYEPSRGPPLTWLSIIARYRAIDMLRKRRPGSELSDGSAATSLASDDRARDPLNRVLELEEAAELGDSMYKLPLEQRRSLLLLFFEGYTFPDLAHAMNAPLEQVKFWTRRGLSNLGASWRA